MLSGVIMTLAYFVETLAYTTPYGFLPWQNHVTTILTKILSQYLKTMEINVHLNIDSVPRNVYIQVATSIFAAAKSCKVIGGKSGWGEQAVSAMMSNLALPNLHRQD